MRLERSFFRILVLKADNAARSLSLLDNLDHKKWSKVSNGLSAIFHGIEPRNKEVWISYVITRQWYAEKIDNIRSYKLKFHFVHEDCDILQNVSNHSTTLNPSHRCEWHHSQEPITTHRLISIETRFAELQNTLPLICISLINKINYCVYASLNLKRSDEWPGILKLLQSLFTRINYPQSSSAILTSRFCLTVSWVEVSIPS